MDIGEQEARRADNQIWNAAGIYGFATGSRGYEPNGEASLYFNTAIGLVRRLYDYRKLEILLTALERRSSGEMQSELLWLGLSGAPISGAGMPVRRLIPCAGTMPNGSYSRIFP